MNLIDNPHANLIPPNRETLALIKGHLKYYHYSCDGFNDEGWGCGYRTLQTILSWIKECQESDTSYESSPSIPSILDIQKALVNMGDKNKSFIGSREWIGSVEVTYCIEYFYKVQSKIIYSRNIEDLKQHAGDIVSHFREFGSPLMMGGDRDCSSKCILGISMSADDIRLLILDPHYSGPATSREELQRNKWVKWIQIDSLDHSSFYNLCCPLLKAK